MGLKETGSITEPTLKALGVEFGARRGTIGRVASGVRSAASSTTTAAKATAKTTRVTAEKTAGAAAATGQATAKASSTTGKATTQGAQAAASGAARGGTSIVKATQKAAGAAGALLAGSKADRELEEKVRSALHEEPGFDASKIEITAKKGIVTLLFEGEQTSDPEVAARVVRELSGVKEVHLVSKTQQ